MGVSTQSTWGLISRVSSRTYRNLEKTWLPTNPLKSKKCSRKPRSKTVRCRNGSDSRPATRSGTTPSDDTGSEPSSDYKWKLYENCSQIVHKLYTNCTQIVYKLYSKTQFHLK